MAGRQRSKGERVTFPVTEAQLLAFFRRNLPPEDGGDPDAVDLCRLRHGWEYRGWGLSRPWGSPYLGTIHLGPRRHPAKRERPFCGARTRAGAPCRARCAEGKTRCRLHGGLATGPKTEAGKARIAESNRRRAARTGSSGL